MRKVIGIDLDDVLIEFIEALCLWHNTQYGTSQTKADFYSYEFDRIWGCTKEEAVFRVRAFYRSQEHANTSPTKGAVSALHSLKKEALHIITARPPMAREPSMVLIEKNFQMALHGVHFTGEDDVQKFCHRSTNKSGICKTLGIEVLIDDSLVHAKGVAMEGIPVLLVNAPWNQVAELPSNIERVFSWNEIMEKLA